MEYYFFTKLTFLKKNTKHNTKNEVKINFRLLLVEKKKIIPLHSRFDVL